MTVGLIGAGVMGETLLAGLLRSGMKTSDLLVAERRPDRAAELAEKYHVEVVDNETVAQRAQTVVLLVKPQDMEIVLSEIADSLQPGALVVSIAAGITTAFIESHLSHGTHVVRAMPNTPALVDQAMSAISPGSTCNDEHLATAQQLLQSVGKVIQLPEKYQDAVTAISGSGPAYIYYVTEAMIEAGVMLGLPRDISTEMVYQTVYGAATMLKETQMHPTVLREQVTSPGGTTVAALRVFDDFKVRAAFLSAMEAARDRSAELGKGITHV
ncbi:MAG: pyrroline-5-carboxylate reductase [Actinomycetes bacterium]